MQTFFFPLLFNCFIVDNHAEDLLGGIKQNWSLYRKSLSLSFSVRGGEVKLPVVFEVNTRKENHRQHCAFLYKCCTSDMYCLFVSFIISEM